MATGPRYAVRFRRKRERKTNYGKRLTLLKSGVDRLVVRLSNTGAVCQIIRYVANGDKTMVSLDSRSLRAYGWKHGLKNVSASYLIGILVASKAKVAKVTHAVFDTGLQLKTSERLFAVLKGAVEGGLDVAHSADLFPADDRVSGKHLGSAVEKDVAAVKDNILKGKTIAVSKKVTKKTSVAKKSVAKKSEKKATRKSATKKVVKK